MSKYILGRVHQFSLLINRNIFYGGGYKFQTFKNQWKTMCWVELSNLYSPYIEAIIPAIRSIFSTL